MLSRLTKSASILGSAVRNSPMAFFARFVSIKSAVTPNPNAKRFETYPEMIILPEAYGKNLEIKDFRQAQVSPLAQLILSIPEIKSVTMNPTSFVVMKKPSVAWDYIHSVLDSKLESISFLVTVYEPQNVPEDPNTIKDSDCETVKLVKELLNTYPAVPYTGP
ncbi:hypothetical protein BLSTO_00548 [Blastocystis sp. subtype 1]